MADPILPYADDVLRDLGMEVPAPAVGATATPAPTTALPYADDVLRDVGLSVEPPATTAEPQAPGLIARAGRAARRLLQPTATGTTAIEAAASPSELGTVEPPPMSVPSQAEVRAQAPGAAQPAIAGPAVVTPPLSGPTFGRRGPRVQEPAVPGVVALGERVAAGPKLTPEQAAEVVTATMPPPVAAAPAPPDAAERHAADVARRAATLAPPGGPIAPHLLHQVGKGLPASEVPALLDFVGDLNRRLDEIEREERHRTGTLTPDQAQAIERGAMPIRATEPGLFEGLRAEGAALRSEAEALLAERRALDQDAQALRERLAAGQAGRGDVGAFNDRARSLGDRVEAYRLRIDAHKAAIEERGAEAVAQGAVRPQLPEQPESFRPTTRAVRAFEAAGPARREQERREAAGRATSLGTAMLGPLSAVREAGQDPTAWEAFLRAEQALADSPIMRGVRRGLNTSTPGNVVRWALDKLGEETAYETAMDPPGIAEQVVASGTRLLGDYGILKAGFQIGAGAARWLGTQTMRAAIMASFDDIAAQVMAGSLSRAEAQVLAIQTMERAIQVARSPAAKMFTEAGGFGGAVGLADFTGEVTRQLADEREWNFLGSATAGATGAATGAGMALFSPLPSEALRLLAYTGYWGAVVPLLREGEAPSVEGLLVAGVPMAVLYAATRAAAGQRVPINVRQPRTRGESGVVIEVEPEARAQRGLPPAEPESAGRSPATAAPAPPSPTPAPIDIPVPREAEAAIAQMRGQVTPPSAPAADVVPLVAATERLREEVGRGRSTRVAVADAERLLTEFFQGPREGPIPNEVGALAEQVYLAKPLLEPEPSATKAGAPVEGAAGGARRAPALIVPPATIPPPPAEAAPAPPVRFTPEQVEAALDEADGDYLDAARALAEDDALMSVLNAANQARRVSGRFNQAMGARPRTGAMLKAEIEARDQEDRGGFDPDNDDDLIRFVKRRGGITPSPTGDLQGEWEALPPALRSRTRGLTPSAMAEALNAELGRGEEVINDAELLSRLSKAGVRGQHRQRQRAAERAREAEQQRLADEQRAFLDLPREEQAERLGALTGLPDEDIARLLDEAAKRRDPVEFLPTEDDPRAVLRQALSEAFLREPAASEEAVARVLREVGGREAVAADLFGGDDDALGRFIRDVRDQSAEASQFMEDRPGYGPEPRRQITPEALRAMDFERPAGGASMTPKAAFKLRDNGEGFETLADLAAMADPWRLEEALGRGHETSVPNTLHLVARIKAGRSVRVYRAIETEEARIIPGILPGAYLTESRAYATLHGKGSMGGRPFRIDSMLLPPDELMTLGDPHEFIYLPKDAAIAAARLAPAGSAQPAVPAFEPTPKGDQALVPGTPRRALPPTKTRAEAPQKPVEETPLFGQEQERRQREDDERQGRLIEERPALPARAAKRAAPVRWEGWQERHRGDPLDLWTLTEDIPNHPVGSTLAGDTLRREGFTVPDPPEELDGTPFRYSSTEVRVPPGLADALRRFAQDIPRDQLAPKGVEASPHVTVRYGLHVRKPDRVIEAVGAQQGPFTVDLGALGVFPDTPDGDVLYVRAESTDLSALHDLLTERLRTTETTEGYRPHVTLAYLKPGEGARYVGDRTFAGRSFEADSIIFEPKDGGEPTVIPLAGPPPAAPTPEAERPGGPLGQPEPEYPEPVQEAVQSLQEDEAGGLSLLQPEPEYGTPEPTPPFFSALREAAEKRLPARASAAMILSTLRATPGVKADEITWTYLPEWLAEQTGPIPRQAVLDYLRDYGVRVVEDLRGGEREENAARQAEFIRAFARADLETDVREAMAEAWPNAVPDQQWTGPNGYIVVRSTTEGVTSPAFSVWHRAGDGDLAQPQDYLYDDLDEAITRAWNNLSWGMTDPGRAPTSPRTQYEGLKPVKGGTGYRELLFVYDRPPIAPLTRLPEGYVLKEDAARHPAERFHVSPPSPINPRLFVIHARTPAQAIQGALDQINSMRRSARPKFIASHFNSQKDLVAHARFDERRDRQGRRGILILEIQDDLDNQIRKKQSQLAKVEKRLSGLDITPANEAVYGTSERAEIARLRAEITSLEGLLPFRSGKSNELVMKLMLRWASEHGYEWLGLVTGAQQAKLYSLSQHVEAVEYEPSDEGGWTLQFHRDGRNISDDIRTKKEGLTLDEVEALVGPSVRRRIEAGAGREIPHDSATQDFLARGRPVAAFHWEPPAEFYAVERELTEARQALTPILRDLYNLGFDTPGQAMSGLFTSPLENFGLPEDAAMAVRRWKSARQAYDRFLQQPEYEGQRGDQWRIRYESGISMGGWASESGAMNDLRRQQAYYDRLVAGPPRRRLEGLDLDVDTEQARGKKKAYDEILPKVLEKLAKPWGQRVEDIEVEATERTSPLGEGPSWGNRRRYEGPERSEADLERVIALSSRGGNTKVSPFTDERMMFSLERVAVTNSARDVLAAMRQGAAYHEAMAQHGSGDLVSVFGGAMVDWTEFDHATIHALPITPQMRAAVVARGFPLFQPEPPYGQAGPSSAAFQRWFEGSKVVDAQGRPLVVYHGTNARRFTAFDVSREGAHFGTFEQAESAADRNRGGGGRRKILPVYLSVKKPLRLPDLGRWKEFGALHAWLSVHDVTTPQETDDIWAGWQHSDAEGWEALKLALTRKGYDAIVYENEVEGAGDSYIVWDPRAIKHAERNRGSFDPARSNILRQPEPSLYETLRPTAPDAASQEAIRLAAKEIADGYPVRGTEDEALARGMGEIAVTVALQEAHGARSLVAGARQLGFDFGGGPGLRSGAVPVLASRPAARPGAARKGVVLHGLAIPAEIERGVVNLGAQPLGPDPLHHLAVLGQPLRLPLWETLRLIATKGDQVVGHRATTSRLPGSANAFEVGYEHDHAAYVEVLRKWLDDLGADGFYVMHNHPGGDPSPSTPDLLLTAMYAAYLPGFRGHVVINSEKYATILAPTNIHRRQRTADESYERRNRISHRNTPAGLQVLSRLGDEVVGMIFEGWAIGGTGSPVRQAGASPSVQALPEAPDPYLVPGLPHELLRQWVYQPDAVAQLGKRVEREAPGQVVLFYASQGWIRAIETMDARRFADSAKASTMIQAGMRQYGASGVLSYAPWTLGEDVVAAALDLVNDGVLMDHVVGGHRGKFDDSLRNLTARGVAEAPPFVRAKINVGAEHVEAPEPPYGAPPSGESPESEAAQEPRLEPRFRGGRRFAGNLGLDKYDVPEQIQDLVDRIERQHHDEFARQARGVVPDVEVARLARELGVPVDDLLRLRPGVAWSAEKILATRYVLAESATQLDALRERSSAQNASVADIGRFTGHFRRHVAIQQALAGLTAEAGRALRQFRQRVGPGQASLEDWNRLIEQFGGPKAAAEAAELLGRLPPDRLDAINAFTRSATRLGAGSMLYEYWINSLLSGPHTHVVNIFSNFVFAAERSFIERALAAGIDMVRARFTGTGRERYLGEVLAEAYALPHALREAQEAFVEAWGSESTAFGRAPEPYMERPHAIPGLAGRVIRASTRALMAEDEFFKFLAYRMALHAEAYRAAAREGLEGRARMARAQALAADPSPALIEAAELEAHVRTFTDTPPEWVQALLRWRDKIPTLRWVVPFIKTPSRILNAAYERTPLYLIGLAAHELRYRREMARALRALGVPGAQFPLEAAAGAGGGGEGRPPEPPRGGASPDEPLDPDALRRAAEAMVKTKPIRGGQLSDAAAKVALGTMVMAATALLVESGIITGGGPSDPGEKRAWLKNHAPYSFQIGGWRWGYKRIEPLGTVMAATADFIESLGERVRKGRAGLGARALNALNEVILDKSWLTGMRDWARAVTDPWRYGQQAVQGFAGSFVPAIIGQTSRALDPAARRAESVGEAMLARTPLSRTLFPRRDIWGRSVTLTLAERASKLLLPFDVLYDPEDATAAELVRLHIGIRTPGRFVGGLELKDDEYDRYQERAGSLAKESLDKLFSRDRYRKLRDDWKIEDIRKDVSAARARARDEVLRSIGRTDERRRRQERSREKLHPDVLRRLDETPAPASTDPQGR